MSCPQPLPSGSRHRRARPSARISNEAILELRRYASQMSGASRGGAQSCASADAKSTCHLHFVLFMVGRNYLCLRAGTESCSE